MFGDSNYLLYFCIKFDGATIISQQCITNNLINIIMEKVNAMNRCADFVKNAEMSSETKDYLVCLGMLEDLDTRMYELLVRDLGEEQVSEDKCGVWSKWRDSTDKVRSLIMENFTDKLMMNLGDLHSKAL